jgi:hypothetical protein
VAVLDVPPQGLSRNVKYGSSFGDGTSRGATGGLNSSEAWFIYLTFRYWAWGALLHFVLTAKFVKFVYIVYFFSRVFSEYVPVRVNVKAVRVIIEAVRKIIEIVRLFVEALRVLVEAVKVIIEAVRKTIETKRLFVEGRESAFRGRESDYRGR